MFSLLPICMKLCLEEELSLGAFRIVDYWMQFHSFPWLLGLGFKDQGSENMKMKAEGFLFGAPDHDLVTVKERYTKRQREEADEGKQSDA